MRSLTFITDRHNRPRPAQPGTNALSRTIVLVVICLLPLSISLRTEAREADADRFELVSKEPVVTAFNSRQTKIARLREQIHKNPADINLHLDLGALYLLNRDGAAAKAEITAAQSLGASPNQYVVPLAEAHYLLGETDPVLHGLTAKDLSPENKSRFFTIRGRIHVANNDYAAAEAEIKRARNASANVPDPLILQGAIDHLQGNFRASGTALNQALRLDPDNIKALYWSAENARSLGQPKMAADLAGKGLALEPGDTHLLVSRAFAFLSLRQLDKAEDDIFTLLTIEPDNTAGRYLKAHLLASRGRDEAALDLLTRTQGIGTYPSALYLMGTLSLNLDRLDEAAEYIEAYLEREPNNGRAHMLLGIICLRQDRPAQALKYLSAVYDANGESEQIDNLLGLAHMALGDYQQAALYLGKASQYVIGTSEPNLNLANSYLATGEVEGAIETLQSGLVQNPESRMGSATLVLLYLRAGKYDQARAAAKAVKRALPDSPFPDNLMAHIDLAESDIKSARQNLTAALKKERDFFPARLTLARLAEGEGHFDDAYAQYKRILQTFPYQLQALIGQARIEQRRGDAQAADLLLSLAEKTHGGSPLPLIARIDNHLTEGSPHNALVVAQRLARSFPENIEALDKLARTQLANNLYGDAVGTYGRLVALLPDQPAALVRLGRAQFLNGDLTAAAQSYDRAMERAPQEALPLSERVRIEEQLRGAAAAERLALGHIDNLPSGFERDLVLADHYRRSGNVEAAAKHYLSALAEKPDGPATREIAAAFGRMDQPGRAAAILTKWLDTHPDDGAGQHALLTALIRTGDYSRAISVGERLLPHHRSDPVLLNNLAWLHDRAGDRRAALKYARSAYRQDRNSAQIQDTYGWILYRAGKLQKALPLLRSAARRLPDDPAVNFHYAAALNAAGAPDNAHARLVSAWRRAAEKSMQHAKEPPAGNTGNSLTDGAKH